ncbi:MAG TPA: hypothetical protein VHF50_01650 [Solirubrobacterales bacterium]|nr:hypothetical protein [Solirubrobacterales bacterium]
MLSNLTATARVGAAGTLAISLASCNYIGTDTTPEIGVPFFAQQIDSFDCGPATVQMWTAYDFGTANLPTQQQISQHMGGTSTGTSPQIIADAVNFYTTAFDAFVDFVAADPDSEKFFSRQIAALDQERPSIAIIDAGFHAVIVVGGLWHETGSGFRAWDYTLFHDPLVGPRIRWGSSSWISSSCPPGSTCQQIVEAEAVAGASSYLTAYGDSVIDSDACGGGGGCTPLNQN